MESARSGNEEKMMTLLTPLNVNCHASDGRKVSFVCTVDLLQLHVFEDSVGQLV